MFYILLDAFKVLVLLVSFPFTVMKKQQFLSLEKQQPETFWHFCFKKSLKIKITVYLFLISGQYL